MEHGLSVTSLLIVILAAFLTPIILHKLKLNMIPVVVAEILVGLIIGNSGFNIVESDMWLETLSTLGFIFLMFLSGLEIDFKAFSGEKKKSSIAKWKVRTKYVSNGNHYFYWNFYSLSFTILFICTSRVY